MDSLVLEATRAVEPHEFEALQDRLAQRMGKPVALDLEINPVSRLSLD